VQRYGRGRSMAFSGEASWRWKMLLPAADRSFEYFWRQAARWIVGPTPDPVAIIAPANPTIGTLPIAVDVRDAQFAGVDAADLSGAVTSPSGENRSPRWRGGGGGHYSPGVPADVGGLYRVHVEARRGSASLGTAEQWMYVGGSDPEFADPRLNEG